MDINACVIDYKRTQYTYECWLPLVYSLLPVLPQSNDSFCVLKGVVFITIITVIITITIIIIVIVGVGVYLVVLYYI